MKLLHRYVGQLLINGGWVNTCPPSTLEVADESCALAAFALAQGGTYCESRVVDVVTGEIDHEHMAPRRILNAGYCGN